MHGVVSGWCEPCVCAYAVGGDNHKRVSVELATSREAAATSRAPLAICRRRDRHVDDLGVGDHAVALRLAVADGARHREPHAPAPVAHCPSTTTQHLDQHGQVWKEDEKAGRSIDATA